MTIKSLNGPRWLSSALALAFVLILAVQTTAADEDWPRHILTPKGAVTLYQPQIDAFQDNKVSARTAVSFLGKGEKEPRFGVVWIDAVADTDRDARTVTFRDYRITDVKFPEAMAAQQEKLKELLLAELPKWPRTSEAVVRGHMSGYYGSINYKYLFLLNFYRIVTDHVQSDFR